MEQIFNNCLEFEVYDKLHDLIINRYKKLKYENACRRSSMSIARSLNKGKNKEIDVETLYSKIGSDITDYNRKSVI